MGDTDPAGAAKRCILLAVPEDGLFAPIIQAALTRGGWEARLVDGAEALLAAAEERRAALVVLDMGHRWAQEALEALKIQAETNWVPVVALFPRERDPRRPQELRVRADVELVEPVAIHDLVAAAESKAIRSSQPPSARKVRMILPSRPADLARAVELTVPLLHASGLDEAAQASLQAALREAIGNAIQHGNRRDPAKSVRVEYRQNPAAVTLAVRDEGPGFDAEHYLRLAAATDAAAAARNRHAEGGQGGLGILMLTRLTDRVRYNKAGNLVNLTKFVRRRS
ncbi:MAG TPA: ATP-binding protein [Planctomycetota bacterium]|nr:ATP-binding protein [Planctomycetota bacterium]